MKSSLRLPTSERTQSNLSSLPPLGPRGLCFEICLNGKVSQRQRGSVAEVMARLKKRARLYEDLASIRRRSL